MNKFNGMILCFGLRCSLGMSGLDELWFMYALKYLDRDQWFEFLNYIVYDTLLDTGYIATIHHSFCACLIHQQPPK